MADNTLLNSGTGGDTIRDIDRGGGIKTQVVQLDGGGTGSEALINSLSAGTGMNGLMVAIGATNYVISTNNATSAQLAPGATFTGVIESGNSEPAISIIMRSDQPGVLTVNQYITSAANSIISSTSFQTQAVVGGNCFARSFTLNGNFVNVTWQNQGGAPTTTLLLDTAYGTLPATTGLLNNPVSLNEVNGVALTFGQATKALSIPVTIAKDQDFASLQVSMIETMQAILLELRVQNVILHQTLNSRDDLDLLRTDAMQLGASVNPLN